MVSQTILLVEDNLDDEALTRRALRKILPLPLVVVARDGVEALDFIFGTGDYEGRDISISPNLVLLDLKLPKVNGLEVLRQLRANARTRTLPIVIFSSSTEEQDILGTSWTATPLAPIVTSANRWITVSSAAT